MVEGAIKELVSTALSLQTQWVSDAPNPKP